MKIHCYSALLLFLVLAAPARVCAQEPNDFVATMLSTDMQVDGHASVDLGLPSGTIWASCNVGATLPEETGDYFSWAETKGRMAGKTDYSWETYAWSSTSAFNASDIIITKYCDHMVYGRADHRMEIEAEDDVASMEWGPSWSIPSKKQVEELLNKKYTTSYYTVVHGVPGRMITSKVNGRSIFLPSSGCYYGRSVSDADCYGCYWTRSLKKGREDGVYVLYSDVKKFNIDVDQQRFCGRSVRPVTVKDRNK